MSKSYKASVKDPTCGRGRMLLSFHSHHLDNYLIREDLDRICCLMSVCNMLIHGYVGEIVWHNSLKAGAFLSGWKINEYLTLSGKLSIRSIVKEESFVWNMWEKDRIKTLQQTIKMRKRKEIALK